MGSNAGQRNCPQGGQLESYTQHILHLGGGAGSAKLQPATRYFMRGTECLQKKWEMLRGHSAKAYA